MSRDDLAARRFLFVLLVGTLPHEPLPLYDMLRQRGFRYSGAPRSDGGFELLIEPAKP